MQLGQSSLELTDLSTPALVFFSRMGIPFHLKAVGIYTSVILSTQFFNPFKLSPLVTTLAQGLQNFICGEPLHLPLFNTCTFRFYVCSGAFCNLGKKK